MFLLTEIFFFGYRKWTDLEPGQRWRLYSMILCRLSSEREMREWNCSKNWNSFQRERTKLGGGLTGEMVTERPTNREQSDYSPQARHTTMLDRQWLSVNTDTGTLSLWRDKHKLTLSYNKIQLGAIQLIKLAFYTSSRILRGQKRSV